MNKRIDYILLFDLYGGFLTGRQKEIFKLYFEEDFSIIEIAKKLIVSKQYIHKTLKRVVKKLESFDKKLQLKKDIVKKIKGR